MLTLATLLIMQILYIPGDSVCHYVENDICSDPCEDVHNSLNISLQQRTYYTITNETNYTYTLSTKRCLNMLSSMFWIDIWLSDCCRDHGWQYAINTDRFTINVKGDISAIASGSYRIYNGTNCIYKSQVLTVPNLCLITEQSELKCGSLLEMVTNSGQNMKYFMISIASIFVTFMILIIIIIYKHRKVKKLQQQIESYYSEFRTQKNSSMRSEHCPSAAVGGSEYNGTQPHNNGYNRYSLTANRINSVKSAVRAYSCNKQQNDECTVSHSGEKQPEMQFLKENNNLETESNSTELARINNEKNYRLNTNVTSFVDGNNKMYRHRAFL